jgi:integrase/recombinase XerD
VSDTIRLHFDDISPDGVVIRCAKFCKSRPVPLYETAKAGLELSLKQRCSYPVFDDDVFISL